ncbi:hypothetical protein GCM10007940_45770 [Portibacter lacus]|uniref:Uncharacterized protein n=1 Tax=Portibacter lacus TaxID=1099794 RepID=A0AA37WFH0_9BACT|nr:hypothetical protein GCM10007940_45770 [Portibacter lacus]
MTCGKSSNILSASKNPGKKYREYNKIRIPKNTFDLLCFDLIKTKKNPSEMDRKLVIRLKCLYSSKLGAMVVFVLLK